MMIINNVLQYAFDHYTPGTPGFCQFVESNCGFEISRDEIERLASGSADADMFEDEWENSSWWTDENHQAFIRAVTCQ